jgi:hypothetical protein
MLDRERRLYAFVLHYARLLTDDLDDGCLADQPVAGINHPAWVLGHLILGTEYASRLLTGTEFTVPPEWLARFGPGSKPLPDRSLYPGKEELLRRLTIGHERVSQELATVRAELLERPPERLFAAHLPTVGDVLLHLLTTHPCTHLGQLSMWRRITGRPAVLGI